MVRKQLELLVRQGEGYNLEFKESFSDSIAKMTEMIAIPKFSLVRTF